MIAQLLASGWRRGVASCGRGRAQTPALQGNAPLYGASQPLGQAAMIGPLGPPVDCVMAPEKSSLLSGLLAAGILGARSVTVLSGPAVVPRGSSPSPWGPQLSGRRQLSSQDSSECRERRESAAAEDAKSVVAHILSSCEKFDAQTSAAALTRLGSLIRDGVLSEQDATPALASLWTARNTSDARTWLQTQTRQAASRSQLSDLVERYAGAMDGRVAAQWLQRLAALGPGPELSDTQLQTVLRHVLRHSSHYSARQIACCALALAQLKDLCDHQHLYQLVVEMLEMQVTVRARDFEADDLVNAVGSLVELGADSRLMLSMAASAARRLTAYEGPKSVATSTLQALKLLSAACELESSADLESRAMQLLSFMAIFKERMLANQATEINRCVSATSTLQELLGVVLDRHEVFDAINISTALQKLSATGHRSDSGSQQPSASELLPILLERLESQASALPARSVANTAHALARMGVTHGPVWGLLEDSLLRCASALLHAELASAAWAMARARRSKTEVWPTLEAEARRHAEGKGLSARSAATLMWSFSKAETATPELLSLLCGEVVRNRPEANPQELSMALWALAKAQTVPDTMPALVEAAGWHMTPRGGQPLQTYQESKHFTAQGLATTVWAMASLGYELPDDMLRKLEHCALEVIDEYTPQGAAMLLWGLASSGARAVMKCESVFQSLSEPMTEAAPLCRPADVAMLLYAYAITGVERGPLFAALSQQLSDQLAADSMDPVNMAMAAWALAALGHDTPEVFGAIAQKVGALRSLSAGPQHEPGGSASCGTPRAVALVSWACATLGYNFPQVFALAREVLRADTEGFDAQGLSNTLWAMAVVDELDRETLSVVRERLDDLTFSTQGLRQLYLVELSLVGWQWQDAKDHRQSGNTTWLPESLYAQAKRAWLELDDLENSQSRVQYARLADLIRSVGIECNLGITTEDNQLHINLGCSPAESAKVAIEIYWRSLCSSTYPFRPLGKAMFRKRLLEARGWRVVGLTSVEWHESPEDLHLAQEWLQTRLGLCPPQTSMPGDDHNIPISTDT